MPRHFFPKCKGGSLYPPVITHLKFAFQAKIVSILQKLKSHKIPIEVYIFLIKLIVFLRICLDVYISMGYN